MKVIDKRNDVHKMMFKNLARFAVFEWHGNVLMKWDTNYALSFKQDVECFVPPTDEVIPLNATLVIEKENP